MTDYGNRMSDKTPLLLIGNLFGGTTAQLHERFDLTQVDDFPALPALGSRLSQFECVAIGMVGSGHISYLAADSGLFDRLPKLRALACLGTGCEFVDMAAATARGIAVSNTPGVNDEETADTAFGLLLGVVRQLPQADRYLRAGRWPQGMFPLTGTLRGKTLGILGLGHIGKAIARRALGCGLDVIYHGRNVQDVPYRYVDTPLALARQSDILMAVVPGGDETYHMVDAEVLTALGADGVLINISRGTVVDEQALIAALRDGVIRSAGIDAFENEPHAPSELIAMDHVVLTPHVGSGTHHTREQMAQAVVDNVIAWHDSGALLTPMEDS